MRSSTRLILVGGLLLISIGALIVPGALWFQREEANIERLKKEAMALGGSASINPGGIRFQDRRIDLFVELEGESIDDDALTRLAAMPGFKHARYITLARSRISDDSIRRLASHHSIVLIDLAKTRVTDECVAELQKIPYLSVLDLSGTQITDAGLDRLIAGGGLANLRLINLNETRVTPQGVRRLIDAFEDRHVTIDHPAATFADVGQGSRASSRIDQGR